ncbi:hypothetical protein BJX64DRAFT_292419 [Aspergillus heterothallicus]
MREIDDALLAAILVLAIRALTGLDNGSEDNPSRTAHAGPFRSLLIVSKATQLNTISTSMIFDADPQCGLLPSVGDDEPLPFLVWAEQRVRAQKSSRYPRGTLQMYTKHGLSIDDIQGPSSNDPALHSMWIAGDLLWYIMNPCRGFQKVLSFHVQKLKAAIASVPPSTWLRDAPEAFFWAILVGTAGATEEEDRVLFVTFGRCLMAVLMCQEDAIHTYFWPCFFAVRDVRWAKMRRGSE